MEHKPDINWKDIFKSKVFNQRNAKYFCSQKWIGDILTDCKGDAVKALDLIREKKKIVRRFHTQITNWLPPNMSKNKQRRLKGLYHMDIRNSVNDANVIIFGLKRKINYDKSINKIKNMIKNKSNK